MKTRQETYIQYQANDGTWHWTKELAEKHNEEIKEKAEIKRKSKIKASIKKGDIGFDSEDAIFYVCDTQDKADALGVESPGIWVYIIRYYDEWGDRVGEYISRADYINMVEDNLDILRNLD